MYAKLFSSDRSNALTDDRKYSCVSLPIPNPPFTLYEKENTFQNKEFYHSPLPKWSDWSPSKSSLSNNISVSNSLSTPLLQNSTRQQNFFSNTLSTPTPTPLLQKEESILQNSTRENNHVLQNSTREEDYLLPVLDCKFNLREICKQSILLEDHLSHEKKRCTDCCIKHFLALEGLCEEAVTLDKEGLHPEIQHLAERIRQIQKLWYENPSKNSHFCSQELRKLRKQFQIEVFPIIFDSNSKSCQTKNGNVCSLK